MAKKIIFEIQILYIRSFRKRYCDISKCYNTFLYTYTSIVYVLNLPLTIEYSGSPKIDTFCVCSQLQKCVNLWRLTVYHNGCSQNNLGIAIFRMTSVHF